MHSQSASPVDGTPRTSLRRAVLVVITGFALAFALNPGSLDHWGYMLNDSAAVRPVQDAAEAVSAAAAAAWRSAGLEVPYDQLKELLQCSRRLFDDNN